MVNSKPTPNQATGAIRQSQYGLFSSIRQADTALDIIVLQSPAIVIRVKSENKMETGASHLYTEVLSETVSEELKADAVL